MRDVFEIRRADKSELLLLAGKRLKSFPILKEIYDDEFLADLVRHKNNYDNLLLSWLVVDNLYDTGLAYEFLKDIEENLKLFPSQENFKIFKTKLRQWKTVAFEAAITELEFSAEYLKRGYQIELEPNLPNNKKGDFSANKGDIKIYFEVKTIYKEASNEDQTIMNELEDRLVDMSPHFRIDIDIKEKFRPSQAVEVSKYILQKLMELDRLSVTFPFSFAYPENDDPLAIVEIRSRVPNEEKGYISGFVHGGGIKVDWNDLRKKIVSGVSQLHPDYPGVIIVKPHRFEVLEFDIKNALYGDLKVNLFGKPQPFRSGERVFEEKRNRRLSAVIFYEKRLHGARYAKKKLIFHNQFAAKRLPKDVFEGENVIQF